MANELNIALAKSGLTVTAQRYQAGAAVGSAISCPETGSSGFYSGNMTGTAGTYQVAFLSASANVGSGSIVWSGTAEVPASTFNPASDTVATVTTLTNAPTVPTAAAIATQVRSELSVELGRVDAAVSSRLSSASYTAPTAAPTAAQNASAVRTELTTELGRLDVATSSRLASSAYTAAPTTAQIATAVEGSLLNEADGQAVLNAIVGAIGNTNLSEVSLVAAVRADLERVGGKIDSIPTTAAPTAAANATAVWATASKTITGGTVDTLTNSPSVPSAASIASATRTELTTELGRLDAAVSTRLASASYTAPSTAPTAAANASAVRTELATELARVDAAVSTRLASSAYTAPANSDVAAIKVKTDALNTDRLANVATTAIVGNLIAQANS